MNISNSFIWILNSIQSSHPKHIGLWTLLYSITLLVQFLCQFSSLTVSYPNPGFNLSYLKCLVPVSDSFKPPSHHTVLCKLNFLPFLKDFIPMGMCMVCLVSLPFLTIHTSYFLSNIMRGDCYETTYGSLFCHSLFIILKCARSIHVFHTILYSLSALG